MQKKEAEVHVVGRGLICWTCWKRHEWERRETEKKVIIIIVIIV